MSRVDAAAQDVRRVAAELAQLNEADRDWILGQLAADNRRQLEVLLGQLQGEPVVVPTVADAAAGAAPFAAMADGEVQTLVAACRGAPDWLARAVVATCTPAERRQLAATLGGQPFEPIMAGTARLAPAAAEALRREVLAAGSCPQPPVAPATRPLRRWFGLLGR